jgi:Flp pilus assembly pilin Flp
VDVRSQEGLTVVEYGLIAALVGIVFVLAGPALADALMDLRGTVMHGMDDTAADELLEEGGG